MAPAAAQRGAPRWMVVLGVIVYCCLCWTLVGIATLSVYRQFTPHEVVAQQGAGGDHTARR